MVEGGGGFRACCGFLIVKFSVCRRPVILSSGIGQNGKVKTNFPKFSRISAVVLACPPPSAWIIHRWGKIKPRVGPASLLIQPRLIANTKKPRRWRRMISTREREVGPLQNSAKSNPQASLPSFPLFKVAIFDWAVPEEETRRPSCPCGRLDFRSKGHGLRNGRHTRCLLSLRFQSDGQVHLRIISSGRSTFQR